MSNKENFEQMLTGRHPNSLGRTLEVVDMILKDKNRVEDLYNCYFSKDEVVRLRVSNAFKRISKVHPDWLAPYIDKFIDEISKINQASTQWTLAILFNELKSFMSPKQIKDSIGIMRENLKHTDWIVLNFSIETLSTWSKEDEDMKKWLIPELKRLQEDKHKSVATRATKFLKIINKEL